jgi:hypothetical protein
MLLNKLSHFADNALDGQLQHVITYLKQLFVGIDSGTDFICNKIPLNGNYTEVGSLSPAGFMLFGKNYMARTLNARFGTDGAWHPVDSTKPSAHIPMDANGENFYYSAGGADPVVWTQMDAWVAPTLTNSWLNYGGVFATAGYWKDTSGVVHLRGLITGGTVGTSAFTLPVGFRPTAEHIVLIATATGHGEARIRTDGTVYMGVSSSGYASLANITFRVS